MDRGYWQQRIEALDPERDHQVIYRILATHELYWEMSQALSFALFRTYAVPSIGRLLFATGELTARTQKRYDDTVLILDAILEHGLDSAVGRAAVRRMNQMHHAYEITNDDLRYVLATFVVSPIRWTDAFGWRPLTDNERIASASYYRALGRHMGIRDLPETHEEFAAYQDAYEARHFAYDPCSRAVADATLDLLATFLPYSLAPKRVVRRLVFALMDEPLLTALHYPPPTAVERAAVHAVFEARARVVRRMPPRMTPVYSRQSRSIRSYPAGYDVAELGTFPRGCPFHGARKTGVSDS